MRREAGSIVVEASVAMTAFLILIATLLSLINVSRIQLRVAGTLNRTAIQISELAYFVELGGIDQLSPTLIGVESENEMLSTFLEEINGAAVRLAGSDGLNILGRALAEDIFLSNAADAGLTTERYGFSLAKSSVSADLGAVLVVEYSVPIPFLPMSYKLIQKASTALWLGGDRHFVRSDGSGEGEDISETVWTMTGLERGIFFKEVLKELYAREGALVMANTNQQSILAYRASSNTYYTCVSINSFSPGYNRNGFSAAEAGAHALRKVDSALKNLAEGGGASAGPAKFVCVVILPEDAPPEVVAMMERFLKEYQSSEAPGGHVQEISYRIIQAGGKANG